MTTFFKRLFTKEKKNATPRDDFETTEEKIYTQIEFIEKRQAALQAKIDKELANAKVHLAQKNKDAATMCLQRKKILENQLSKLQAQHLNTTRVTLTLEETRMNQVVMDTQVMIAKELEQLQKDMSPEKVERDMEHLKDLIERTNEVSLLFSQPLPGAEDYDENELAAELAALDQEEVNAKVAVITPLLPAVPSMPLPATSRAPVATVEEDELAALERELNS